MKNYLKNTHNHTAKYTQHGGGKASLARLQVANLANKETKKKQV
jgi:hypothetical protein